MIFNQKKIVFLFVFTLFPLFVFAQKLESNQIFFIEPSFDILNREKVVARLLSVSSHAYFFVEQDFWAQLSSFQRQEWEKNINLLASEFDNTIYPKMTSFFGSEWKPGIDNDEKIVVLFHRMNPNINGYFREDDEYYQFQIPKSNQHEMVYLNTKLSDINLLKDRLAHEFMHLISFNQKTKNLNLQEEIWLEELRAEMAPFVVWQDSSFFQERIKNFLAFPNVSLIDWNQSLANYGIAFLFGVYLTENYGLDLLNQSLKINKTGIDSLNEALLKKGYSEKLSDIFHNFLVALFVNDCSLSSKFCFKNEHLKNFKLSPQNNFLSSGQESILTLYNSLSSFSGNWQRIIGGKSPLRVEFKGGEDSKFNVSYVLCKDSKDCKVEKLVLDGSQKNQLVIDRSDNDSLFLTFIISLNENRIERRDFSLTIFSGTSNVPSLPSNPRQPAPNISCKITQNLFLGMRGNEVVCLQTFLKSQGPEIYPEGLVTGYFGPLTRQAVVRFQEKYQQEILAPWGLAKGTGFVGKTTRQKIEQLLR